MGPFITDLGIVVTLVAIIGVIFSRYNLPMTVGYILAGVIAGPHIPFKMIDNASHIQMLSDLGVMFLMFSIGLGFSLRKTKKMTQTTLLPAIWDFTMTTLGGYFLGRLIGWNALESFLLGLIFCDSSTSIAAKTLEELKCLKCHFADSIFGIAVLEDILAIIMIAVLNGFSAGTFSLNTIGSQVGALLLFLTFLIILGILFIPQLINWITETLNNDELLLFMVLGLCFSASLIADFLHLSIILGAFIMGVIISEARARKRIERTVKPVANLFAAVFFVSVGLQVEPFVLLKYWDIILLATVALILLKLGNNTVSLLMVCETPRDAFKSGIGLGQVAEFSFIIATLGMKMSNVTQPLMQIATGIALLTTATNPYLLRYSDSIYNKISPCFGSSCRTFLHNYRLWFKALEIKMHRKILLNHIKTHIFAILIELTFIGAIFGVAKILTQFKFVKNLYYYLQELFPLPFQISTGNLLTVVILLIFSAPIFLMANHSCRKMFKLLIDDMIPTLKENSWQKHFNHVLLNGSKWLTGLLLCIYALFLSSIFLEDKIVQIIIVMGFILLFGNRVLHNWIQSKMRNTFVPHSDKLIEVFQSKKENAPDSEELTNLLDVNTKTIHIPRNAEVDGKTLAELNIRLLTGASIISIYSENGQNISPGANTIIKADDYLIAVGRDVELKKVTELLTKMRHG